LIAFSISPASSRSRLHLLFCPINLAVLKPLLEICVAIHARHILVINKMDRLRGVRARQFLTDLYLDAARGPTPTMIQTSPSLATSSRCRH